MSYDTDLHCDDGTVLKGTLFPPSTPPIANVIVAPGAAAEARFYHPFCEFLAGCGLQTLTFDFRTIGRSTCDPERQRKASFSDWIEQDYPAAIRHARASAPGLPLIVVGHSAGGWMAGVQPSTSLIDGLVGIAALSAYWRHIAKPHRYAHWLAWHVVVPIACTTLRVWPGIIGFRKKLQPGFGMEFSRWARHRDFVFSEARLGRNAKRFRGHLHLFQIADDPWGTEAAVDAFSQQFPHAASKRTERIVPAQGSSVSIGHFGMFRRMYAETLWPQVHAAIADVVRSVSDGRSAIAEQDTSPTQPAVLPKSRGPLQRVDQRLAS